MVFNAYPSTSDAIHSYSRRPHILHLLQCPFLLQFRERALFRYSMFTSHIRGKHLAARRNIRCANITGNVKGHTNSTNSINQQPHYFPLDHPENPIHSRKIVRSRLKYRTYRTLRKMKVQSEADRRTSFQ